MDISNNIKAIRNAKGMSQAEVARRLELDPSAYHRLENRGSKLSVEQIEEIAIALGVSFSEVLNWGENKAPTIDQERLNKLEQDLRKADELLMFQREKIEYLQSSSADLVVEMAFSEFDNEVGDRVKLKENTDTSDTDLEYSEEEWLNFLGLYLIQNDWAWELVERGITDEKAIMKVYNDTGMPIAIPKDIKRKQRKRQAARRKSVGDAF